MNVRFCWWALTYPSTISRFTFPLIHTYLTARINFLSLDQSQNEVELLDNFTQMQVTDSVTTTNNMYLLQIRLQNNWLNMFIHRRYITVNELMFLSMRWCWKWYLIMKFLWNGEPWPPQAFVFSCLWRFFYWVAYPFVTFC